MAWYDNPPPPATAYGRVPTPTIPVSTAGGATNLAKTLQSDVYSQLPGYSSSIANVGQNIQSETAGQLPADVISLLTQQGAERGIATGSPGSPNSSAAFLRALGLTSLDMTQRGQQNLTSILPTLPGAGIASNPGFYVNPSLNYEGGVYNANLAAAPDPMQASLAAEQAANRGVAAGRGSMSSMGKPSLGLAPLRPTTTTGIPGGYTGNANAMGQFYNGVWYPTGTSPSDGGLPTGNMYGGGSGSPVEEILKAYPPGGQAWSDQDIMDWGSQPQYGQAQPQGAFSDASDYFSE